MKLIRNLASASLTIALLLCMDSCKKEFDVPFTYKGATAVMDETEKRFQDILADIPNIKISIDSLHLSNGATIPEFIANNPEFEAELNSVTRGLRTRATDNTDLAKQMLFTQALLFVNAYKLANITESVEWDVQNATFKNDPYFSRDYLIVQGKRHGTPKQPHGLGYSYGQRNWRVREAPPKGDCQDDLIYGLDTPGSIQSVFQMAGLSIPDSSVNGMQSIAFWQNVLRSRTGLEGVRIDYLRTQSGQTTFPTSAYSNVGLKAGDLVFWKKTPSGPAYHAGIVIEHGQDKKLGLFQANGINGPDSENTGQMQDCDELSKGDCKANYHCAGRGVRVKDLSQQYWSETNGYFTVIRMQAFAGNAGNPRFNLQFDNHTNVDLDLHVRTPAGVEIYYGRKLDSSSGGQLDLDCLCGNCANGPNENIYWPLERPSPRGKYRFWVRYYRACPGGAPVSNYQIMLVNDLIPAVLFTANGSLGPNMPDPTWEYDTETGTITRIQ